LAENPAGNVFVLMTIKQAIKRKIVPTKILTDPKMIILGVVLGILVGYVFKSVGAWLAPDGVFLQAVSDHVPGIVGQSASTPGEQKKFPHRDIRDTTAMTG
jgi:hypothetical protein